MALPAAPASAFPTPREQARRTPTFQPALTLTSVQSTCETMAKVAATAPNPSFPGFPGIFTLLQDGENTTPLIAAQEASKLAAGGEATTRGVS